MHGGPLLALVCAAASLPSRADPCAAMGIPADRCTRWDPGIPGGIPRRTAVCATIDAAAYGDDRTDAAAAIQGALAACPPDGVVQLPPGRYRISKALVLDKPVVLRGAGPDRTRIRLDGDKAPVIFIARLWPEYRIPPVDVVADLAKGATAIPVASSAGYAAGDVITIDQLDDTSYLDGGGCRWMKRGPNQADDRRPVSADGYRAMGQMVEVTAVEPGLLRIATPLHLGFRRALHPQIYKPSGPAKAFGPTVKYAGLEDLYVTGGKNGMIKMINAAWSWIRNVESDGSTATGAGLVGEHAAIESCYRCVVRDSYFHDATHVIQGGGAYGISLMSQTSESLVENNIVFNLNKPMVMRASGGGNVVAYNYIDDAWTDAMPSMQETTIDGGHASFPHMELFEGNQAAHLGTDAVWGNSGWLTFFRNYASSQQQRTPLIPETFDVAAVGLEARSRYLNVVGNVLGVPDRGLMYEVSSNPPGTRQPAVYRIGHRADGGNGGGSSSAYEDGRAKGSTFSTLLRHGNFDYVTRSVVWAPGIAGRALPPSLYLAGKPAFFGDAQWPWVDPLGPTHTFVLPAKRRFDELRAGRR